MSRKAQIEKHTCRDCGHSHSYHENDLEGNFFLCKCNFKQWSQFLDIPQACDYFKPKTKQ